jgi:hypothetical protein
VADARSIDECRKYVARGLCVLETKDGARGACQYQIVISAMKKFTGGPGDDDDLAEVPRRPSALLP